MSQVQAVTSENEEPASARPVKTLEQGGVEVSFWKNPGQDGDLFNTTICNPCKDESGEWKETKSLDPTDLAVLAQLSSMAFQAIKEMKAQGRAGSFKRY